MNKSTRILAKFTSLIIAAVLTLYAQIASAQSVGDGVSVINLNDWGNGFNVTFEYEITPEDVVDDLVRDWRIEIDYSGAGSIGNPYMTGYAGTVTSGFIAPDGGFAITNEGVGYRSELAAGFKLQFTVQGQGAGFNANDFAVEFVNLTKLPTNEFVASLVSSNDWYNPSWGGGFNATFRCDVLGPDADIGPVTDLLIDFNYSGSGTPTSAWTQSHNGPIEYGFIAPDGSYAIQNLNGFQPELYAGDSITFAIQVQDAGFSIDDFDIQCSSGGSATTVNAAPSADSQSLSVIAGESLAINLSGSDPEGDTLSYAVTQQPQQGSLTGTAPNLQYTAVPGSVGTDVILFTVSDGELDATGTIDIDITQAADPLVAVEQSIDVVEDEPTQLVLSATGGDGSAYVYSVVSGPVNGTLSGTAPDLIYTPAENFSGTDTIVFQVADGGATSTPATISIVIGSVNDGPVALDITTTTDEDVAAAITLDATDTDSASLNYEIVSVPSSGELSGTAPDLTYTPNADFSGTDTFTYSATDGELTSNIATVTIVTNAVNDAPTAQDLTINVLGNETQAFTLVGSDIDSSDLAYELVQLPAQGNVTGNAPNLSYEAAADMGTFTLLYTVNDGELASNTATVTFMVEQSNAVPVFADIADATILQGQTLQINLSATDDDGDALSYALMGDTPAGLQLTPEGELTWTANTAGDFPITVSADDGNGGTAQTTFNVIALAFISQYTTLEDTSVELGLNTSAGYPAGSAWEIREPAQNGLAEEANGVWTYTPDTDYSGVDTIGVRLVLADGAAIDDDIILDITAVNDAPVAGDDQTIVVADGASVDVELSGTDIDSADLTFSIATEPTNGSYTLTDATLTYTPNNGFAGDDVLVYSVSDGELSDQANVTFTVEVNTDPVISSVPDSVVREGETYTYAVQATDDDGDVLTYALLQAPEGMSIDAQTGEVVWVALASGVENIEISVADDAGGEALQAFSITVLPLVPPVSYTGTEFLLTFNPNLGNIGPQRKVFVSSEFDFSGVVEFPGRGNPISFSGAAGTVATIDIDFETINSGVLEQHAIRITTDREAAAYAINEEDKTTDAFLIFPVASLGTEYLLPSFYDSTNGGADTQFSIVGNEDQTSVDITAKGDMLYYGIIEENGQYAEKRRLVPRDETLSVVLDRDQTLYFDGENRLDDFTGTRIVASKPVAVFSGHKCSFVPLRVSACDHLVEQVPPVDSLGDYYITHPLSTRVGGDTFRAIAHSDNTVVKINGRIVATLNSGEFHEQLIEGASVVESNKPFLLAQYSNGAVFDGDNRITIDLYNEGIPFESDLRRTPRNFADPFMIIVPPVSQYISKYIITTPTSELPLHFVNLIVPSNAKNTVTIDGVLVDETLFSEIGQSGYFGAGIPISEGAHDIRANGNFGLYVYGYGEWESYGYLGGMALSNQTQIAASLDFQLLNNSANVAGSTTCIASTVLQGSGEPIHNTTVDFKVVGVSNLTKREFTDSAGQAQYCYTSSTSGLDTITVESGGLNVAKTFLWSVNSDAGNIAPKITSLPTTRVYAGENYGYQIAVQDANSDAVEVSVSGLPSGASFDATSNYISWSVPSSQAAGGLGTVLVTATDGRGGVDTQQYNLESRGVRNEPPAIDGLTRYGFLVGRPNIAQFLPTYVPDESRSFDVENKPDGMSVTSSSGGFTWFPTIDQVGESELTLVVSESKDNGVARKDVTVIVAESNTLPTFTSQPPSYALVGETVVYDADAYDPEGYPVWFGNVAVFLFSFQTPPEIDRDTGVMSWTPTRAGTYRFTVGANDPFGPRYQYYDVIVKDANQAPIITSAAPVRAVIDQVYSYQVIAEDADGDELAYSLTQAPAGMSIDAQGLISWQPTSADIGSQSVTVQVDDGFGEQVSQTFQIDVVATNAVPVFTAFPAITVQAHSGYSYTPEASDADGDVVTFSLVTNAPGMLFDAQLNTVSWTPSVTDVGEYTVTVVATDGIASTELIYTLSVTDMPNTVPVISSSPPSAATAGLAYEYQVQATDSDGDALTYSVVGAPVGVSIDATTGLLTWTPDANNIGTVSFEVVVTDGEASVSQVVSITVRADNGAPVVDVRNPEHLAVVTAPVDIGAFVQDDDLVSWRLLLQREGRTEITELASGTTEFDSDTAGVLDPTMLINGLYTVAIIAEDSAGNTTTEGIKVIVDGKLKVGNFTITFNDLTIPMMGIPIEVNRTYDSRRRNEDLDFGYGWTIDYQNVEITESRVPGKAWAFNQYIDGVIFGDPPSFCVEPLGTPMVTVRLPDDKLEEFDIEFEEPCHPIAVLDGTVVFKPRDGTTSELRALDNARGRINTETGEIVQLAGEIINPNRYELTTKTGYVYVIDQEFGIETVTDPNGHRLTYSDSGIIHSAGKNIDFVRNTSGRIIQILDPKGNSISYDYDSEQDLVVVTDRALAKTEYTYNSNHGLLEIIDALGRPIHRNIYDDDGRLIAQQDGEGNQTSFNHNLSGRESVYTDRLGRTTAYYYDDRGNITSMVNALGQVSTYTYDQYDNELSETNPLGHTVRATYDDEYNQLTQVDALGNTTVYEYNRLGQEVLVTDPRGFAYENVYDFLGNLLSVTDPLGNVSNRIINTEGLPYSISDAEGYSVIYEYDDEGNITKETNAEEYVTTYTYDSNNNRLTESKLRTVDGVVITDTTSYEYDDRDLLVKTTDALGNVFETEYDALGRVVATVDPKGRRTLMSYDIFGRETSVTFPDGLSATKTYDLEGNNLTETDQLGRITLYEYDALNRSTVTFFPDDTSSSISYDAAGRILDFVDESGNTITQVYNAADRRIGMINPSGDVSSYEYDLTGNLVSQTDPKGNTKTHTYDELDQLVKTTFDDGTSISMTFDKRGLNTSKTDQNGRKTSFNYDGVARLISVTDALNQVTSYTYDAVGNMVSSTDALGRVTRWSFDALNRQVSRTLPLGQTETFEYDVTGNQISHLDFNGAKHTFEYDNNNDWLVAERWADGDVVLYEYSAVGSRIRATDKYGPYTYSYDDRDRLIREVKPNGSELQYQYDAVGNRTMLTTIYAGESNSTSYAFDNFNRLSGVTHADGRTTSYLYDETNNLVRVDHANGTSSTMNYDELNRITNVSHLGVAKQVLASLTYELDLSGRRTAIREASGRTTEYDYDELYRLIGETIVDPQNGNHSAIYMYDAANNRVAATTNGVTSEYSYDTNDRLIAHGFNTYTYDDNGNTIFESVDGQTNFYQYDSQNHLVEANIGGVSQNMAYDPDGIRFRKTLESVTTSYLTDSNRSFAQVLVESTPVSTRRYTFGHDLIESQTDSEFVTYHTDALGSTRLLTNASGVIMDDVRYDAWGKVLAGAEYSENQYLYAGEQFDDHLNKTYLRARYYSPNVGRFSQMDEYNGRRNEPITQNKFAYANQDPALFTDPSGYASMLSHSAATNSYFQLMRTVAPSVAATAISRALVGAAIRGGAFAIRHEIKKCIRPMGKQKCRLMIPILASGNDFPTQRQHIWAAQTGRGENISGRRIMPVLRYQRSEINRKTWPKHRGSPRGLPKCEQPIDQEGAALLYGAEVQCDEYPFSASKQGGYANYKRGRVSARYITRFDNYGFGFGPMKLLGKLKRGNSYLVAAFPWIPASVFLKPKRGR